MNTKRINKFIAGKIKMPAATVARITASFVEKLDKELRTSRKPLRIPGLGRFKVTSVKSHPGYDIKSGGTREFPKSIRVHFKTDKRFKTLLNNPIKERQERDKKDWMAAREQKKNAPGETISPAGTQEKKVLPVPETVPLIPVESLPDNQQVVKPNIPEPVSMLEVPKEPPPAPSVTETKENTQPEPSMLDWEKKPEPAQSPAPQGETIEKEEPRMDPQQTTSTASPEIKQAIKETADYVQRRMLIIFGSVLGGLILLFVLGTVLIFHSKGFYGFVKTKVMMVNEENKLTYEQIDALVAQRMKDLQLDLSQTKDIFKNELYTLQDSSEKKIRGLIMSDVMKELRGIRGTSRPDGKPLIRIIRYKVRKGDNLWRISELKSRNPYNWVGIYETNGHKIKNPNLIYPGQIILIPIVIHC